METRVNDSKLWSATLLKSIGDAVITTDGLGTIQTMNGAAEAITGWAQEDAMGKAVSQVLQLRNAETLSPAETQA